MLDFILLVLLSVALLYFPLHYLLVAGVAFLIGLFKGGLDFIFKLVYVALASAIVPWVYAYTQAMPVDLLVIGINAAAITTGYAAGSLLSAVLIPVKLTGKLMRFFFGLFKK